MKMNLNLTLPAGFEAGGIHAGIKPDGRLDLGMIVCRQPASATLLTTTNLFPAAPVLVSRERALRESHIRGVIANSGNANAVTGAAGIRNAEAMAARAEKATGNPEESFLVASTGVIGRQLPMKAIRPAIPKLAGSLSPDGWPAFAESIMTTDTAPKLAARTFELENGELRTVLGVAKGAGMIQPDMATMLAFIATDFPVSVTRARSQLRSAAAASFHCLTIDGQTSTNDMVTLLSAGDRRSRTPEIRRADGAFGEALTGVCRDLTRQMAADGEGATKLVTIDVRGTTRDAHARRLAREIANSALVKTALFGELPNWGRIVQALGQAGVRFDPEATTIKMQGMTLLRNGAPAAFDREALRRALKAKEVAIDVAVGQGAGAATFWTCDYSHDYIRINAEYN